MRGTEAPVAWQWKRSMVLADHLCQACGKVSASFGPPSRRDTEPVKRVWCMDCAKSRGGISLKTRQPADRPHRARPPGFVLVKPCTECGLKTAGFGLPPPEAGLPVECLWCAACALPRGGISRCTRKRPVARSPAAGTVPPHPNPAAGVTNPCR